MSLINVYGVGAGHSIAGEQEDNSEKIRQRRLTVAQKEEQVRRSAVLRERFSQAEAAGELRATQAAKKRELNAGRAASGSDTYLQSSVLRPSAGTATQRSKNADEREAPLPPLADQPKLPMPRQPIALGRTQVDDEDERLQLPGTEAQSGVKDSAHDEPGGALQNSRRLAADCELSPMPRLTRLVDDLPTMRGAQFADKLVSQIDEVLAAFRGDRPQALSDRERDELHATLEFLDGYVEASRLSDVDRQRILQRIEVFRQESFGAGSLPSAVPTMLSVAASTAAVARQVAERGRIAGVPDVAGGGRSRPSESERRQLDHESENEAELQGLAASSAVLAQSNPIRSSKSSLSKDAEKRREETLVTVTVRSV